LDTVSGSIQKVERENNVFKNLDEIFMIDRKSLLSDGKATVEGWMATKILNCLLTGEPETSSICSEVQISKAILDKIAISFIRHYDKHSLCSLYIQP
jgi:hypothetical protein